MALSRKERLYFDSSVIGGYYDPEFAEDSKRVIGYAQEERIVVLMSEVVVQEILKAPARVQEVMFSIPSNTLERIELTAEILSLRDAYLSAQMCLHGGAMMPCMSQQLLRPEQTLLFLGIFVT